MQYRKSGLSRDISNEIKNEQFLTQSCKLIYHLKEDELYFRMLYFMAYLKSYFFRIQFIKKRHYLLFTLIVINCHSNQNFNG